MIGFITSLLLNNYYYEISNEKEEVGGERRHKIFCVDFGDRHSDMKNLFKCLWTFQLIFLMNKIEPFNRIIYLRIFGVDVKVSWDFFLGIAYLMVLWFGWEDKTQ